MSHYYDSIESKIEDRMRADMKVHCKNLSLGLALPEIRFISILSIILSTARGDP